MSEKSSNLYYNKDFMLLFIGGLTSRIGNGIHNLALVWYVLELTGSGSAAGTILFLSTLPGVIFGPLGGIIADRINRKILLCGMDFIRGLVVLIMGYLIYLGELSFFQLGLFTVIISICGTFFNPALNAVIPGIVKDDNLEQANSMENISMNFTQIIGAALGGVLIGILGFAGAFLFNGLSFIMSGISELFIIIPGIKGVKETKNSPAGFYIDLKEGFSFLTAKKELLTIFSYTIFFNFLFNGLFAVGIPFVFNEILETGSTIFGLAKSSFPAGAVLGSILINYYVIKNYQTFLGTIMSLQCLMLMSLGLPILPIFLSTESIILSIILLIVIMFITGIFNAATNVPIATMFHRLIPDNLRGRLFGLLGTFSQGLAPLSMALTGVLVDNFAVHNLFFVGGGIAVVLSLSIFKISGLENLDQESVQKQVQKT